MASNYFAFFFRERRTQENQIEKNETRELRPQYLRKPKFLHG